MSIRFKLILILDQEVIVAEFIFVVFLRLLQNLSISRYSSLAD
jgi:hypothetical protein